MNPEVERLRAALESLMRYEGRVACHPDARNHVAHDFAVARKVLVDTAPRIDLTRVTDGWPERSMCSPDDASHDLSGPGSVRDG